jgi:hypothetical protein
VRGIKWANGCMIPGAEPFAVMPIQSMNCE